MKIIDEDTQPKVRRRAAEPLTTFNLNTREPLGIVLDLSARGMKLRSDEPTTVSKIYYCRLPLKKKIDGQKEVFFDAECRWCNKYEDTGRYYSGFLLRFPSRKDAGIVRELMHDWMKQYNRDLNTRLHEPREEKTGLFTRLFRLAER